MKILVSGASGLLGSALTQHLSQAGHTVLHLVRHKQDDARDQVLYDIAAGTIEMELLEGLDAIVHLGGASIAKHRWSQEVKDNIRFSRVRSTELLVNALSELSAPPKTFLCASAIGYYGSRGDAELTEEATPGEGFLAEVCQDWEAAAQPAREHGVRVVNMRMGMVLSRRDGALARMLLPFRLGLGGVIGNGLQYMSWIDIDDLVRAIEFLLADPTLQGPVNLVAPSPVTNRTFTKILGRALHRPTLLPLPAFMVKLIFGQMGESLLLDSARVLPKKLEGAGFRFDYATLEDALRHQIRVE